MKCAYANRGKENDLSHRFLLFLVLFLFLGLLVHEIHVLVEFICISKEEMITFLPPLPRQSKAESRTRRREALFRA